MRLKNVQKNMMESLLRARNVFACIPQTEDLPLVTHNIVLGYCPFCATWMATASEEI